MQPQFGRKLVPVHELYNYTFELPFESKFNEALWTEWIRNNWFHSIWICCIYVLAIYWGRMYMSRRAAFELKKPLAIWNFAMALFSVMGAARMSPEFAYVTWKFGFRYSICTSGYVQLRVTSFWAIMFTLSKPVELIDTVFIVLRKRPLIFLHWYHHITVMLLTWYGAKDHTAPARWFILMNYTIHSVMYFYYGLSAIRWRAPKWISASVTTMQIIQMLIGCYIAFHIYKVKATGQFCQQTDGHLLFSIIVYFSYLILFVKFFCNAYLNSGKKRAFDKKDSMRDTKKIA